MTKRLVLVSLFSLMPTTKRSEANPSTKVVTHVDLPLKEYRREAGHTMNFNFIGKPKMPEYEEADRKKWHGMPPTRVPRERLTWRGRSEPKF